LLAVSLCNTGLPMLAGGCLPRLATNLHAACVAERCQASLAADAFASGIEQILVVADELR